MTGPNIVLMVADDMGYGDFGLYSEGRVHTPALDELATQALRLTQHYAGSAVCSPSRAALLTGRYPIRTGAVMPQEVLGNDRIALGEVTIANSFKAAAMRPAWSASGTTERWIPAFIQTHGVSTSSQGFGAVGPITTGGTWTEMDRLRNRTGAT